MNRILVFCGMMVISSWNAFSSDVDNYKMIFKKELATISIEYGVNVAELDDSYSKSLRSLSDRILNTGDLPKSKAVLAEIERFSKVKKLSEENIGENFDVLKRLQLNYIVQMAGLNQDKAKKTLILANKYDSALNKIQVELTKQGKLDDASGIEKERASIQENCDVKSAKEFITALAQKGVTPLQSSPSEVKVPDEKVVAKPKEVRQEEAIMLIYCDDECQSVCLNGDNVVPQTGREAEITIHDGDILAIKAWDAQGGLGGGLIVGLKLKSTGKAIVSDGTWLYSSKEENGWQDPKFNDKDWKKVKIEDFDWLVRIMRAGYAQWGKKPKIIWGKGGTVYFRKQIFLRDFG